MNKTIFIEGNFPSFKNSKRFVGGGKIRKNGKRAKPRLIMSATVSKYLNAYGDQWKNIPEDFINIKDKPLLVAIHFVRGTKHRFDFHNMVQGVADLMVTNGWIEDDNMNEFIPFPFMIDNEYYSYNKDKPGVYIKILNQ